MVDFPHKIAVPRHPHLVSRQRLRKLLHEMVRRQLITLTAPAGYGKTALLIELATKSPPLPICWYSVDAADRDPWTFLQYLALSIAQRFPGRIEPIAAAQQPADEAAYQATARALLRDIDQLGQHLLLIIDNWQHVDSSPAVSALVSQLLACCPKCHVLLSSRYDPSLPDLQLLDARHERGDLTEQHLRFTASEAISLLKLEFPTPLPHEQVEQLIDHTNGWGTGMMLALQDSQPDPSAADALALHSESLLYRYLAEQVFDQQPPELQRFMLDSALLDEITAERCDALFGTQNASQTLQTLLHRHLFITKQRPGALYYLPLFRTFLLTHYRHTDQQRFRATSLRIAETYIAQSQWIPAFQVCITTNNLAAARSIVQAGGEQLYQTGQLDTLERWFEQLPFDQLDTPLLCLSAHLLISRGRYSEARVHTDMASARRQPEQTAPVQLLKTHLAVTAGHYQQALQLASQVYESSTAPQHRATALRWLGVCQQRMANHHRAIDLLQQALVIEQQYDNLYAIALLQQELGMCHVTCGRMREAEEYFANAEAYWVVNGNIGLRVLSLQSQAVVQRLTGRYEKAHRTLSEAQRLSAEAGVPEYLALVRVGFADLYNDLQLWQLAAAAYDDSQIDGRTAYLAGYTELIRTQQLVRQQDFPTAQRALQQAMPMSQAHPSNMYWLLRAKVLFGLGRIDQAASEVQTLIDAPNAMGAPLNLARCHILQARIKAATDPSNHAAVVAELEQACQIADRMGHDSFLVLETLDLADLLQLADTAGWVRSTDWLRRQQQLRQFATNLLDGQGLRVVAQAFGEGRLTLNDRPIEINWTKAREVLHYLLAFPEGGPSATISEHIWPELSIERGQGTLKTAVYNLRSTFSHAMIGMRGRKIYQINREAVRIDYDVERFQALLDNHRDDRTTLLEAVELYRGPYLPWSDNAWSAQIRTRLEQRYLQALHRLAVGYEQARQYADALITYGKVLEVDRLDEAAHTGVMRCYEKQGNPARVLEQYRLLCEVFFEELGIQLDSDSEAEQIYQRVLKGSE